MTKDDLVTIIQKIKNRCGLETATKITYYWKDDKVIFKIFFDSLYLPKNMRIDNDNVLESFIQSNVYEYDDDFQIIGLNQDEGYIEVLPDDQKFKIIKKYKDIEDNKKEESLIHLADKQFNEVYAKERGFILNEGPTEKVDNPETGGNDSVDAATNAGKGKDDKVELNPVKVDVKLISVQNPASEEGQKLIDFNSSQIQDQLRKSEYTEKVLFGITDLPFNDYPQTVPLLCSLVRENLDKDTYVFPMIPNPSVTQQIKAWDIVKVTEVTENAAKTVKANNINLKLSSLVDNPNKITDTSDIKKAKELADKLVTKAEDYIIEHKGWRKMSVKNDTSSQALKDKKKGDREGEKKDQQRAKVKDKHENDDNKTEFDNTEKPSELNTGSKFNDLTTQKAPEGQKQGGAFVIGGDWKKWVDNYNDLAKNYKGQMTLAKALCEDSYRTSQADIVISQIKAYQNKVKEIGQSLTNIGSLGEVVGVRNKLKTIGTMMANDFEKALWDELNQQREEAASNKDANTGSMNLGGSKHMGVEVASHSGKSGSDKKDKKKNTAYMASFPNDFDVFIANQTEFVELMNCFDAQTINVIYAPGEIVPEEKSEVSSEEPETKDKATNGSAEPDSGTSEDKASSDAANGESTTTNGEETK